METRTPFRDLLIPDGTERNTVILEVAPATYWKSLSETERAFAQAIGFCEDAASIWPKPDSQGDLKEMRVSLGEEIPCDSNPWWMAGVCEKLPAGTYRFAGDISDDALAAGALGWLLVHYRFDRYKSNASALAQRRLVLPHSVDRESIIREAEAISFVRDLINTPAEDMGPAELQAAAENVAQTFGASHQTIVGDDLLKKNFPAIHAVGRAAGQGRKPRLIDLQWGERGHPLVVLVGKGVCFDTGGLGLKPAIHMRTMKKDMAGAAHVLGLAQKIMAAKLPVRLRVLIPAVENSVSANSYRPGDVIKTRNGSTVEIDHTDAEGRIILCDTLAFASEQQPGIMFDFATLTGANTIALGPDLPGVFCNSDTLWRQLEKHSNKLGDPLWRMPLWKRYEKKLKSEIADANHRTPGFDYAGGTTAALFLQKFINPEIKWAHFDFYAWNDDAEPGRPKGAAAMGIRAAFDTIRTMAVGE